MLKLKKLSIPGNQVAGMVLAGVVGHWCKITSDVPRTAEFTGANYNQAKENLELFFHDESFEEVESLEEVGELQLGEITAAESN